MVRNSSLKNALVLGYGSIGRRHAQILSGLGCHTSVVSSRLINFPIVYSNFHDAILKEKPEYVVLANSTAKHYEALTELVDLNYKGTVLVEKPLFDTFKQVPSNVLKNIFIGYNLRFHPVINRLKNILVNEKILSMQVYAGQYLPTWRPETDYRAGYSAHIEMGGGVLRDLSHELDYITWLAGQYKSVCANGGHVSSLEIDSDDVYTLMLTTELCPFITIQLNYLDRIGRRSILINTELNTIEADLISGEILIDGKKEVFQVERDESYRIMHQAILSRTSSSVCSVDQGLEVLRLIDDAEKSMNNKMWVFR